ncbi:MAG TPA: DUF5597 domain-containing protein [Rhodothermales bacterium]|nr:DUF5597 domain-containing protein [Rhodothermales bacterium]
MLASSVACATEIYSSPSLIHGLTVTFAPHGPGDPVAGIERIEEGVFVDGQWQRGRVLNGDQSHQGRHLRLPPGEVGIQRLTLYRYR